MEMRHYHMYHRVLLHVTRLHSPHTSHVQSIRGNGAHNTKVLRTCTNTNTSILYIHSHYYSVAKWSEIHIHESHVSYDCFMDMDMLVHGVLCLNVRVDRH